MPQSAPSTHCILALSCLFTPLSSFCTTVSNMEAYFSVAKPTRMAIKRASSSDPSIKPVPLNTAGRDLRVNTITSSKTVTNVLLKTLSDPSNPITHSDIFERTDHIVSCSSGHQVSNGRRSGIKDSRSNTKLNAQQQDAKTPYSNGILNGARIYIDGYLESTTDIEMKRLVLEAGGQIVLSAPRCTHILTSRGLSGSKTHNLLTRKTKNMYVVKPEWVLDSIAIGKRRPERSYAIVKQANTLQSFLEASK